MPEAAQTSFLDGTVWQDARIVPLAKDASVRRYHRLTAPGGETAILAHDPSPASLRAFVSVGAHLLSLGLSAPRVFKTDERAGLLLLEDFGDALFPKVIAQAPEMENRLYHSAIDALFGLHTAPPPSLRPFSLDDMADQAMVAFAWYGGRPAPDLQPILQEVFARHIAAPTALMLRDVHAENLIWLPEREGPARTGLLDFQDARLASPLYDFVSLIEDARRDVPRPLADALYQRAAEHFGMSYANTQTEVAALSLQRNLRILGVFARLCLRDGRQDYLRFVPRVWGHVIRALDTLGNDGLSKALLAALPAPTTRHLQHLGAACGTIQTP